MNQEEDMNTPIERSLDEVRDMELPEVPPAVIAAGVVAAVVGMGIIGWMVFRRRRRTIVQRLQDAIPGPVRGLPTEVQARIRRAK
ncbi:MAG TPA: hypothetical protein VGT01_01075 [Candidatus Dormibacteraeota bacterium]|nr:hypothetical protein [Candidatus Dormibacteraeota bacterium]HEV2477314.1 hypothetical protein [Candidatus Dormibacteraeota bacterium]